MLRTDDRVLLVDLLTPPAPGYRLERAVGTTFTMQLESLLRVPLAVVGAEWRDGADPLGVMEAVRSSADRIDVFCQAGMLAVPASPNAMLAFLEPIVHQVRRPRGDRLFHPKVWLASFTHPDEERRFRFLCGSRNLTSDRAWDTVVGLDGVESSRRRRVNGPLSDFIGSLADRVPLGVDTERSRGIQSLADAVRQAEWDPPDGVADVDDWLRFHWLDAGRSVTADFGGKGRHLVVSPFLNEQGLEVVWPEGGGTVVSRAESFSALGDEYVSKLRNTWQADLRELDDAAALPDEDDEETELRWSLRGLHAKTYIVERGHRAQVFIGSANATGAAWSGNTEFMVELSARRSVMGVDAALSEKDGGFGTVLRPYASTPSDEPDEPTLQALLERALIDIAAVPLQAVAEECGDDQWLERVASIAPFPSPLPDDATLTLRLLTTDHRVEIPAGSTADATWRVLRSDEITPFLVAELAAGSTKASCVVMSTLDGAPQDRLDRLIAKHVGSPEAFMRFVLLLLALGNDDSTDLSMMFGAGGTNARPFLGMGSRGLLEPLVSTLADHPETLLEIDRLVDRLSATDDGLERLPTGWMELWPAILEALDQVTEDSP